MTLRTNHINNKLNIGTTISSSKSIWDVLESDYFKTDFQSQLCNIACAFRIVARYIPIFLCAAKHHIRLSNIMTDFREKTKQCFNLLIWSQDLGALTRFIFEKKLSNTNIVIEYRYSQNDSRGF